MESLNFHISQILEYFANKSVDLKDACFLGSYFKDGELTIKSEETFDKDKTSSLINDFILSKKKKLISYSLTRDKVVCYVEELQ